MICRSFLVVWIALTVLPLAGPAVAQADKLATSKPDSTKQEILNRLFADLKAAKTAGSATAIANVIWREWFKSDNADVSALMARYRFAQRAGLRDQQLLLLNKIIQIAPEYIEGWNQRATLYFILGRNAESVSDIQKVLELEPRHFGALAGLGLIHMRAENWKSAIASFERALELHPFLNERTFIPMLRQRLKGQPL